MADSAFETRYRQEVIAGFEQRQSLLRRSVTTESMVKSGSAVFLVQDSNSATAANRGLNGLLPYRANNLTQSTATLKEWHDPVRMTGFNIFASTDGIVSQMQADSIGTINRKSDDDIIAIADTCSNDTGAATTMSLDLFLFAKVILGVNEVEHDGQICAVMTPAAMAYLHQTTEFGSSDYVTQKPMQTGTAFYDDTVKVYDFLGVKIIEHPRLTGVGTSAEKCFMYHRRSIGHAIDSGGIQTYMDYNKEHDYSYVRTSAYFASVKLQNSGGVLINHDGSAYAAQ